MLRMNLCRQQLSAFKNNLILSTRSFLSNEYKDIINERVELPLFDVQKFHHSKNLKTLSAIEVDLFVHNLNGNEDQRVEICQQLVKLQSSEFAGVLNSTHGAVVRHFIETENPRELITILSNRLEYGIFIDDFLGCYLLNYYLEAADSISAALLAVQLMLQENLSNSLLVSFAIKSCYDCIRQYTSDPAIAAAINPPNVKPTDIVEKKVRVTFLRNYTDNDRSNDNLYMIGKTLLSVVNYCPKEIQQNIEFLGEILCEQYNKCLEILQTNSPNVISSEIAEVCTHLLKEDHELFQELKSCLDTIAKSQSLSFEKALNTFFQDNLKEESVLISKQKKIQNDWSVEREEKLQDEIKRCSHIQRQENIENILDEISSQKQKLWFFSSEDKIDLDIYKKKVTYPKRWFGKKKKPRIIDENYIPPEITRKS